MHRHCNRGNGLLVVFITFSERKVVATVNFKLSIVAATKEIISMHGEGEGGNGFLRHFYLFDVFKGVAVHQEKLDRLVSLKRELT